LAPRDAAEGTATECASIVQLIVAFLDRMRTQRDDQIGVLIPVVIPTRWRYRILHNQLNLVLSHALQARPTEYARSPLECQVEQPRVRGLLGHTRFQPTIFRENTSMVSAVYTVPPTSRFSKELGYHTQSSETSHPGCVMHTTCFTRDESSSCVPACRRRAATLTTLLNGHHSGDTMRLNWIDVLG